MTVHQILIVITLFNDFSDLTLFLDNSYSFHSIVLNDCGQLDFELFAAHIVSGLQYTKF